MTRFLCISFVLVSTGCYLSHRPVEAPDAGLDGSPQADTSVPPDTGLPLQFTCRMERRGDVAVRTPTSHQAQAPDVYWDGRQVGVVVMEGGGTTDHPELTLARIAPDLSTVEEPIRVGEQAHGWGEVAWAGDRLALCYHGDPGGPGRTMFRTVARDGSLGARSDIDELGEACLDLVATGEGAFMGWRHRIETEEGFEMQTLVAPIGLDGELRAEPMVFAQGPYPGRSVNLAADGRDALVAIAADDAILVVRLDPRGAILNERLIEAPGAVAASIAAADPGGAVALAIMSGPREARSLSLVLLDRSLAPTMDARLIADGAPSALSARIERAPDGWWVSWAAGNRPSTRAMLLHVDDAGQALESRFTMFAGHNSGYGGPQMQRVERDLYVGLSLVEGSTEGVHLQRWTCVEERTDPCEAQDALDVGCDESGELAAWRWTGAGCALVSCPGDCSGADCADLAPSRFACESDHALCPRVETCEGEVIPLAATRACLPRGTLRSDEPMYVTLSLEMECPCLLELECEARVSAPFEVELLTRGCRDIAECDRCAPGTIETLSARCELPPLGAGTWSIRHEGGPGIDLEVVPRWETPTGGELCSE